MRTTKSKIEQIPFQLTWDLGVWSEMITANCCPECWYKRPSFQPDPVGYPVFSGTASVGVKIGSCPRCGCGWMVTQMGSSLNNRDYRVERSFGSVFRNGRPLLETDRISDGFNSF